MIKIFHLILIQILSCFCLTYCSSSLNVFFFFFQFCLFPEYQYLLVFSQDTIYCVERLCTCPVLLINLVCCAQVSFSLIATNLFCFCWCCDQVIHSPKTQYCRTHLFDDLVIPTLCGYSLLSRQCGLNSFVTFLQLCQFLVCLLCYTKNCFGLCFSYSKKIETPSHHIFLC